MSDRTIIVPLHRAGFLLSCASVGVWAGIGAMRPDIVLPWVVVPLAILGAASFLRDLEAAA